MSSDCKESVLRTFNSVNMMGSMLMLVASVLGCSRGSDDPYDRIGFSGTVTLDGTPMKNGVLYLEPLEKQPTQSFAVIENGTFHVDRPAGAVAGRYKVAIVLDDSVELPPGVDPQTPEGSALADKLARQSPAKSLHSSYNSNSKLVAELQQDGPNEFVFDLKSNPEK